MSTPAPSPQPSLAVSDTGTTPASEAIATPQPSEAAASPSPLETRREDVTQHPTEEATPMADSTSESENTATPDEAGVTARIYGVL